MGEGGGRPATALAFLDQEENLLVSTCGTACYSLNLTGPWGWGGGGGGESEVRVEGVGDKEGAGTE